jgi:GxxExxY protein
MFEKAFFTTEGAEKSQRKHGEMPDLQRLNEITNAIIGAAIEVHKKLGPGLLESAYQECLAREFVLRNINFEKEKPLPVEYKGVRLECGYRLDFLVEGCVVVEIKSIEAIAPIHEAQLLTYLSLGGWKLGLLLNFNVNKLTEGGIRRKIL